MEHISNFSHLYLLSENKLELKDDKEHRENSKLEEKIESLEKQNISLKEEMSGLKTMFRDILEESENFAFSLSTAELKTKDNSEKIR